MMQHNTGDFVHWYRLSDYLNIAEQAMAYANISCSGGKCYAAIIHYNAELQCWIYCRSGEAVNAEDIQILTPIAEPPAEWIFGDTLPNYTIQADGTQRRRESPRGWVYGQAIEGSNAIAYIIAEGRPGFVVLYDCGTYWTIHENGQDIPVQASDIVCWTPIPCQPEGM